MYTTNLTKGEIIQRIVNEWKMYQQNAEQITDKTTADLYRRRAEDIKTLMAVLEITERGQTQ